MLPLDAYPAVGAAIAGLRRRPRRSQEALARYQSAMLRRLVQHAYARVPYYRALFDEHRLSPRDIRGVNDLALIPITSRTALQQRPAHDLLADRVDMGRLSNSSSSGSSGRPLTVRRARLEQNLLHLFRLRAERRMGARATDRWLSVQELPSTGARDNKRIGRALASVGFWKREPVDIFLDPAAMLPIVQARKPDVISGYASALGRLARAAEDTGLAIRPRLVLSGSEVLSPALRSQIERGFHAPVYDCYGSEECGLIAWQCPQSGELHSCDDAVLVEVLDDDGQPTDPGEAGEVVVTNLHAYAMPFLRYRLGDIATRGAGRCACGEPWGGLREIRGRSIDYFRLPGGRIVHPYEIVDGLVKPLAPWLREHQIVQEREDLVVLRLVPSEAPPADAIAGIERAVREFLGPAVELDLRIVANIPLEPSGKFRPARSLVWSPGEVPPVKPPAAPGPDQGRAAHAWSRLLVETDERFLVPAIVSRRARLWVAARNTLSLPLLLRGQMNAYYARIGATEVRALCLGREKRFAELLDRLLPDRTSLPLDRAQLPTAGSDAYPPGTASHLLAFPATLADLRADLVAATVHPWFAEAYRRAGWTIVPDVVRWQGDLAAVPPPTPHRSLRSDLRKAERYGYTLEIAHDPADWEKFYREMLLPQARQRFGTRGWTPSQHLHRRFAALGTLLFARRDARRVAGACAIRRDDRTIWFPLVAVRNGDPTLLREGAATAILRLAFDWARDLGFDRVDSGRSSPFLNDGVHASKRKWGLTPTPDPLAHLIAVRIDPGSTALRERLSAEPVLVVQSDGLHVRGAGAQAG